MALNETDLSQEQKWLRETLCKKAVQGLEKNNMYAEYLPNREEALARVKELIPQSATIGIGDSVTLHEIGLFAWLESEPDRVVFNPFARTLEGRFLHSPDEIMELRRKVLTSDVFLASSNAVTLDGKLVNIDGLGNRVAAMIFGPKKTILVVGANKIVKDIDQALKRIKTICAPLNFKRHLTKHGMHFFEKLPCVITGTCIECTSPNKACRKIVIIDGEMEIVKSHWTAQEGKHVILVGESLGI